jgi:hypothetical protein
MTRTERAIVLHWRGLATVCAIVALFGIAWAMWHRMDADRSASDRRYTAVAREADKRGTAVSTLAGDVRALRAQVQAQGETPVAPDPSRAVEDLPDRAEVPVPVPGPPGPEGAPGSPGPTGSPGQNGTDGTDGVGSAGPTGAAGTDGAAGPPGPAGPQGDPGPAGPQGEQGAPGADGQDGRDGQTCPDGYSLQPPNNDPDALVCRRDTTPAPSDNPSSSPSLALDPSRRQYT